MRWTALTLELDASDANRLSDRLIELGAASVIFEDLDAGTPAEQAVFDEPGEASAGWRRIRLQVLVEDAGAGRKLLEQACADERIDPPAAELAEFDDRDWVRSSQSQFSPIQISRRLWVVPSWHRPPDPGAINLIIDPGLAFGTGSHPTTRLCLQWLEREIRGGETVIDYGCGSGILSIAARRLGAARVIGIDIDPQALDAARANAARNGVECEFFDASAAVELEADRVVANILANPLRLLAPALASLTRAGGRLALAGLLASQADEIAAIYAPWFGIAKRADEQDWTLLDCGPRIAS